MTLSTSLHRWMALGALATLLAWSTPSFAQHAAPHGEVTATHDAAATHDEHASAAHDEHGGHGPVWDMTRLAGQFVNFGLWAFGLITLLGKILPKSLGERRAAIVDGLEEAKAMTSAAESKYAEYSKRIETMDAELARVREQMKAAGVEERDRLLKDASDKSEKMRAEARFLVEQQLKQLREDLTREAIEAAVKSAEQTLRDRMTAADQTRLANDYLTQVQAKASPKSIRPAGGAQ